MGSEAAGRELRVLGVKKRYLQEPRPALDGVQFSIPAGSISFLVGRSGSGKSTLLHCIAGLERLDDGEIWLGETALHRMTFDQYAAFRLKEIGLVFQSFNLLPTLSIEENIQVPGVLSSLPAAKLRERSAELLERTGLSGQRRKSPHEVSGGELQRAALCRAVFLKPSLVLADEASGNLDSQNAEMVVDLLRELAVEQGCTVLYVTHDESLIPSSAKRLHLSDGRVL